MKLTAKAIVDTAKTMFACDPTQILHFDFPEGGDEVASVALATLSIEGIEVRSEFGDHPDPAKARLGMTRVTILGPETPRPIEEHTCYEGKSRKAAEKAANAMRVKLEKKHGRSHGVEVSVADTAYLGLNGPEKKGVHAMARVWRADDLELIKLAHLTRAELSTLVRKETQAAAKSTIKFMWPFAAEGVKFQQRMAAMRAKRPVEDHTARDREIRELYKKIQAANPFIKATELQQHVGTQFCIGSRRVRDILKQKD